MSWMLRWNYSILSRLSYNKKTFKSWAAVTITASNCQKFNNQPQTLVFLHSDHSNFLHDVMVLIQYLVFLMKHFSNKSWKEQKNPKKIEISNKPTNISSHQRLQFFNYPCLLRSKLYSSASLTFRQKQQNWAAGLKKFPSLHVCLCNFTYYNSGDEQLPQELHRQHDLKAEDIKAHVFIRRENELMDVQDIRGAYRPQMSSKKIRKTESSSFKEA